MPIKPELGGVPETALWTLWFRAQEARREHGILTDPLAIELVEKIDYPFTEKFGDLFPAHAQIQALRVLTFDREVERFLAENPHGTVVALGEGMETQFWRVDNGSLTWLTVDLPESIAVRRQLLPAHERLRVFAGSALDPAWMELVGADGGVLITAQGLLMYLEPAQVDDLIARCAKRFPGGSMVFDAVPPWMAGLVRRGTQRYQPPPLPWSLQPSQLKALKDIDPAIVAVRDIRPPGSRGFLGWILPKLRYLPVLRNKRPMIVELRFG